MTKNGVVSSGSIRRLPPQKRWTTEDLGELKGLPWEPTPGEPGEVRVKSATVMDEDLEQPMKIAGEAMSQARSFQIRKDVELKKFGYTVGCKGCEHAEKGLDQRPHTPECRARIQSKMMEDDVLKNKVERARARAMIIDEENDEKDKDQEEKDNDDQDRRSTVKTKGKRDAAPDLPRKSGRDTSSKSK